MIANNATLPAPGTVTFDRLRQVIEKIIGDTDANGYPPTVREIARELGVCVARVQQLLELLMAAGIVSNRPGMARTLTVDRAAAARLIDV